MGGWDFHIANLSHGLDWTPWQAGSGPHVWHGCYRGYKTHYRKPFFPREPRGTRQEAILPSKEFRPSNITYNASIETIAHFANYRARADKKPLKPFCLHQCVDVQCGNELKWWLITEELFFLYLCSATELFCAWSRLWITALLSSYLIKKCVSNQKKVLVRDRGTSMKHCLEPSDLCKSFRKLCKALCGFVCVSAI